MKKKVFLFISIAMLILAMAPIANIMKFYTQNVIPEKWWGRSSLYNLDFSLPYVNGLFYKFGISFFSEHVVIGKNDWLYLGENYEKSITSFNRGPTIKEFMDINYTANTLKSLQEMLRNAGVRQFQIILAANKSSIYPEFLPAWVQPNMDYLTDVLLQHVNTDREIYYDTRPALIAAKNQFAESLYYTKDSHWNYLGAWIAFRAFIENLIKTETHLRSIPDDIVYVADVEQIKGGDLANMLKLSGVLKDTQVHMALDLDTITSMELLDFETGQPISDITRLGNVGQPILIKSPNALNNSKVLWIKDSFGEALIPLMTTAFTDILHVHYINGPLFIELVEAYKPDYVFLTIVERNALFLTQ